MKVNSHMTKMEKKLCSISYPYRDLGFPKFNKEQPWLRIKSDPKDMK